ncbi:MAG: DNA-dependent RNA polymerase [Spirochaetia bacterium]|nr:DNA-dependent RNA polymerase [Spirochaetia bacterium]
MRHTMNVQKNDFSAILAAPAAATLEALYGPELAATQLALEHEAYMLGEARFIKTLERQVDNGQAADSQAAKPIMQSLHGRFVARINTWIEETAAKDGKKPHSLSAIRALGAEKSAALTLKVIISRLAKEKDCSATDLAARIGGCMEDEARFGRLRELEGKYFEKHIEKALNQRTDEAHKKAFLSAVEGHITDLTAFAEWSKEKSISTGYKMIELAIEGCELVERHAINEGTANELMTVTLNQVIVDKINTRAFSLAGISPIHQPMVVQPKPWVSIQGGGYWADGRRPTNLVRCGSKKALMRYADVTMPEVYAAVNTIQNTAWRINERVLNVVNACKEMAEPMVEDFPRFTKQELPVKPEDIDTNEHSLKVWKKGAAAVYRREKARVSRRLSCELTIEQANKFSKFPAIWFPYNMDWRGRVYAMPQFNPQGDDMTKGLLTLAQGKPVGADGIYWLMIHTANCAGVDKVSFEARVQWVNENKANIIASAQAPLDCTWWAEQDSPFCFLAACFEMAGCWEHGESWVSSLPIAFDGSCSGIQHFSAMLRDEIGGAAVNLTNNPDGSVSDIYGIVAAKVNETLCAHAVSGDENHVEALVDKKTGEITEKLILGSRVLAEQWLAYGVTRKVTKRSVMTLAYGSKEFGFRDQLLEDIINPAIDAGKEMFVAPQQAAGYMAKLIWEAVTVTVVKAVEAMKWLQSASKLLAAEVKDKKSGTVVKERMPTTWVTTDGFPVFQEYRKPDQKRLKLLFLGQFHVQPTINVGQKEIDQHKQESGIAPNFVHSQDGAHLRSTINHAARDYGIQSFAVIHDSFGTIPADAGNLFKAVRESMVNTYQGRNLFEDFRDQFADQLHDSQVEKMPAIPAFGKLNLNDILESKFAFA